MTEPEPVRGLDYAFGSPSPAAIKAAGYRFVVRYLPKLEPSRVVVLTPSEYAGHVAQGTEVAVVYESADPGRMRQGAAAGRIDAPFAFRHAQQIAELDDPLVYFACDFDAAGVGLTDVVEEYVRAAEAEIGHEHVGLYAGTEVIEACQRDGLAYRYWQAAGWREGRTPAGIHLSQTTTQVHVEGVLCDVNFQMADDFGQLTRHAAQIDPPTEEVVLPMSATFVITCTQPAKTHVLVNIENTMALGIHDGSSSAALRASTADPSKIAVLTERDYDNVLARVAAADKADNVDQVVAAITAIGSTDATK